MIHGGNKFHFSISNEPTISQTATVHLPASMVKKLYQSALHSQKKVTDTYGFSKGETPLHYIEHNFRPNILEHIKELLFTHCVMNFLYYSLYKHKIVTIGLPLLRDIQVSPENEAQYLFQLHRANIPADDRWKKVRLKAPERKNYKDLDRQVESFLKEEQEKAAHYTDNAITLGDWVYFEISLVDAQHKPLLDEYHDSLWVKISTEEADLDLHDLFLGKKVGDTFLTNSSFLQEYITTHITMNYIFKVVIKNHIPAAFFSLDQFKRHFQLKTPKETHLKLIEVFSYRNDISQRRETVEATLKTLLKQYFISIPHNLLEKQKQSVLDIVHENPDYHVYKAQQDFKEKIKQLAEKQLKECIIIDSIAYQENIEVSEKDIESYLNLIKRPRTKEFVYFNLPSTKLKGQEAPISIEVLKHYCLREKTLNYVIHQLTK